jgi:hypothetical protein
MSRKLMDRMLVQWAHSGRKDSRNPKLRQFEGASVNNADLWLCVNLSFNIV